MSEYTDTHVAEGQTYYYRIDAYFPDTTDLLSYPVKVDLVRPNDIQESEIRKDLIIIPNPAIDRFQIILNKNEPIIHIMIYDVKGRISKIYTPDENNCSIPVNDLESGTYIVQVITDSKNYFLKFIKQ
jgi:hypothetical protein